MTRVLLVEDDPAISEPLARALGREGYEVLASSTGREALTNVEGADLVVLDADTLSKFRNFGKKSMDELNELMERLGLTFGMDVSKYNLDND